MNKFLLFAAIAAATANAYAAADVYTYTDQDGFNVYGSLRRVSPNGQWAAGGDDLEKTGAFVIKTSEPENLMYTSDGLLNDIDNNGLAVGAWYQKIGYAFYKRAAIYKDGMWTLLPEPEEILKYDGVSMTSEAVAISADSRVIAGHAACANDAPDEPGKYFPVTWTLNPETGKYELDKLYNSLSLPGAQGFFVYDMTPNAKFICGLQTLNLGSTIPVMLNRETGELKTWHEIGERTIVFQYKDNWYQNDVMTVDGLIEEGNFNGVFVYATDNYLFGKRGIVVSVDEEGYGETDNPSTVYDIYADEFIDGNLNELYLCGTNPNNIFNSYGEMIINGVGQSLSQAVGSDKRIDGVYSVDESGKIWTGAFVYTTPIGDQVESPVLVVLEDSPLAVKDIVAKDVKVLVNGNTITVDGADQVAIYSMSGVQVSKSHAATVKAGSYLVVADGKAYKIAVR